jgi:gamma-glutamyltranspeptidase/glutathione hydrolase
MAPKFRTLALATLALSSAVSNTWAQDRAQSRSMLASPAGVVASESVLVSQVGARVLENGGNAVDAAIAVNAMMGLVAQSSCAATIPRHAWGPARRLSAISRSA